MSFKRFYLACLLGILAGVVCVWLASSGGDTLTKKEMLSIFTGRVLIGFVIGISGLRIGWALHGLFIGLSVSIPGAFGAMMSAHGDWGKWEMFAITIVMGMLYGFVIELVTSVLFNARLKR